MGAVVAEGRGCVIDDRVDMMPRLSKSGGKGEEREGWG